MEHPFAVTLDPGTSLKNRTGSWRTSRPVYVHRLSPCSYACPAGEDVQGWLAYAEGGDYEAAWRKLTENNPFPAVMGRVCYYPCENACNRAVLDSAVGINSVERFLGDLAISKGWRFAAPQEPSGKKVLIIGAGPSGLSAAYHLARLGHAVTIKEAGPLPGGMMRFGIPKYRLPRDVLDAEVQRIVDLGVRLEYGAKVKNIQNAMTEGGFDAAFLGVGAHIGKRAYIPAGATAKILDTVQVLRSMDGEDKPLLGRRVVVCGGGNAAIDVARTAKRLGAEEAVIVYRRTRNHMPADDLGLEEALEEGIMMKWLSTVRNVETGAITVEKMALDEKGFPQPTGELETLEADSVVLALGQDVDLSLLDAVPGLEVKDGIVQVGPNMMSGAPGIFASVPSERSVTVAVGHGRKAALNIDAWLRGEVYSPPPAPDIATADKLNTWYYGEAPKTVRPVLEMARRTSTFEEVVQGLDESNALYEARRCLSCGTCFECDNCYGMCPDNAVTKLGPGRGFEFKYDYCKGCGICAQECPCGAIAMAPEAI